MWDWFWELDRARSYLMGFEGSVAHPLTFPDLHAWAALNRVMPYGWQIKALMAMDRVRVALLNEIEDVDLELALMDEPDLTVEVFDMLFPG